MQSTPRDTTPTTTVDHSLFAQLINHDHVNKTLLLWSAKRTNSKRKHCSTPRVCHLMYTNNELLLFILLLRSFLFSSSSFGFGSSIIMPSFPVRYVYCDRFEFSSRRFSLDGTDTEVEVSRRGYTSQIHPVKCIQNVYKKLEVPK